MKRLSQSVGTTTINFPKNAPNRLGVTVPTDAYRLSKEGVKLLIVEDNPVNQKVAARALTRLGFEADITSDGKEAVEAFKKTEYALILMDCMMPEMDGYEATRAIRALEGARRRTPILAFTADKTAGCRERCLEAGMDDYLTKPLNIGLLEETIDRLLTAEAA